MAKCTVWAWAVSVSWACILAASSCTLTRRIPTEIYAEAKSPRESCRIDAAGIFGSWEPWNVPSLDLVSVCVRLPRPLGGEGAALRPVKVGCGSPGRRGLKPSVWARHLPICHLRVIFGSSAFLSFAVFGSCNRRTSNARPLVGQFRFRGHAFWLPVVARLHAEYRRRSTLKQNRLERAAGLTPPESLAVGSHGMCHR